MVYKNLNGNYTEIVSGAYDFDGEFTKNDVFLPLERNIAVRSVKGEKEPVLQLHSTSVFASISLCSWVKCLKFLDYKGKNWIKTEHRGGLQQ